MGSTTRNDTDRSHARRGRNTAGEPSAAIARSATSPRCVATAKSVASVERATSAEIATLAKSATSADRVTRVTAGERGNRSDHGSRSARSDQSDQGGFTLVEAVATMVLAVFTLLALHSTAQSAIAGRKNLQRTQQAHLMAAEFMDRIRQLPFGRNTDPAPSDDDLTELFDDDQTLGPITLHQLAVAPDQPGRTFTVASNGLLGTWRIKVCNDLDGDGGTAGAREGRTDLMRVQVWFDGQLLLETMRAAEVFETIPD